jgi:NitT/TauT family transport system substrate-binding protein
MRTHLSLLRGVCQTPAYVAHEMGFFRDEGVDTEIAIAPTAWAVPARLAAGESQFAVIPWTRSVPTTADGDGALIVVCGSGHEEAAIVVRAGLTTAEVRTVTVPIRGGMKDLTAMALLDSLGWRDVTIRRQPSGDGAIISLFGQGCDAASMVEPYATMMERLGVGTVVRRSGDVWPGVPGCSLTTTARVRNEDRALVEAVVRGFVRGVDTVRDAPDEAAEIAAPYIGVSAHFIEEALGQNSPDANAIRNDEAMQDVLATMVRLGYLDAVPDGFTDLSFLDAVAEPV